MNKYRVAQALILLAVYCFFFFLAPWMVRVDSPILYQFMVGVGVAIPVIAVLVLLMIWLDKKANIEEKG